jgi:hypothetical protein
MGKPHGNSRLSKIGRPVLQRKKPRGGQKGNRNALRHGGFGAEGRTRKAEIRALIRETGQLIAFIDYVSTIA